MRSHKKKHSFILLHMKYPFKKTEHCLYFLCIPVYLVVIRNLFLFSYFYSGISSSHSAFRSTKVLLVFPFVDNNINRCLEVLWVYENTKKWFQLLFPKICNIFKTCQHVCKHNMNVRPHSALSFLHSIFPVNFCSIFLQRFILKLA